MKTKKSLLFLALALTMVFISSCGAVKDKLAENAIEGAIKKATGAEVDIKGDTTTIKSADGTFQAGDALKWPKEKMGDLPEPKAKITTVMSDDKTKGCTIAYSSMGLDDAKKYIENLLKLGYKDGLSSTDKDAILHSGQKADGSTVFFTYNITSKEGAIVYTPPIPGSPSQSSTPTVPPAGTDSSSKPPQDAPVDMTDVVPWPNGFLEGIPELKGKITDIQTRNDVKTTIYLEYVEKSDVQKYIEVLKKNGYTVEKNESTSVDNIHYAGYNEKNDWVEVSWQGDKRAYVDMEKAQ